MNDISYSLSTYPELIQKLDTMSLDDALDLLDVLYNNKKIDRNLYVKACYNRLEFCSSGYEPARHENFYID